MTREEFIEEMARGVNPEAFRAREEDDYRWGDNGELIDRIYCKKYALSRSECYIAAIESAGKAIVSERFISEVYADGFNNGMAEVKACGDGRGWEDNPLSRQRLAAFMASTKPITTETA